MFLAQIEGFPAQSLSRIFFLPCLAVPGVAFWGLWVNPCAGKGWADELKTGASSVIKEGPARCKGRGKKGIVQSEKSGGKGHAHAGNPQLGMTSLIGQPLLTLPFLNANGGCANTK